MVVDPRPNPDLATRTQSEDWPRFGRPRLGTSWGSALSHDLRGPIGGRRGAAGRRLARKSVPRLGSGLNSVPQAGFFARNTNFGVRPQGRLPRETFRLWHLYFTWFRALSAHFGTAPRPRETSRLRRGLSSKFGQWATMSDGSSSDPSSGVRAAPSRPPPASKRACLELTLPRRTSGAPTRRAQALARPPGGLTAASAALLAEALGGVAARESDDRLAGALASLAQAAVDGGVGLEERRPS